MTRTLTILIGITAVLAVGIPNAANAATEQAKQAAIDAGLAWLAGTQQSDGRWEYGDARSDLAATASAALAFVEEGYLPYDGSTYGTEAGKAVDYVLNRALTHTLSAETAGYWHHAEDYNNSGAIEGGEGNGTALYFGSTDIYSNGIVAPLVHALGTAYGKNTVVGRGSAAVSTKKYAEAMQDIVDWFSWGQVEPNRGVHRGGWRYLPNYSTSDNSTAQWGSLPILYAKDWGLGVPQQVKDELNLYIKYIQNANGGSGYDSPSSYVNVSKTGGLLLEMDAVSPLGDITRPNRVQEALNFINGRWNNGPSGTWYGNLNHPYAMWAVYKALFERGMVAQYGAGAGEDFLVGFGMSNAPGGFLIGQDWWDGVGGNPPPAYSLSGDWYSHYCDYLVNIQNASGSWSGYSHWTNALATGWYINILNATGAPPPQYVIPEPLTMLCVFGGIAGLAGYVRKRRSA